MPLSPVAKRNEQDIYWPIAQQQASSAEVSLGVNKSASAPISVHFYPDGGRGTTGTSVTKAVEDGKKISRFISSSSIEEDENMTTKLTLETLDLDRQISQGGVIKEGDAIHIFLGYGKTRLFDLNQRFILVRSHPHFTRDGIPTVQFIGYDGRFAMISKDFLVKKRSKQLTGGALARGRRKGIGQSPTVFKNKRQDQIIDTIAYHYGYSIDVDQVPGNKTAIKKKDISHWEFIRKMASKNNYTTWVDWDDVNQTYCIHYRKKPDKYDLGYVFHYGNPTPQAIKKIERLPNANNTSVGTLLEFHPTLDSSRMITDIEVIQFDRKERVLTQEWLNYQDKTLPPPPPDKDIYDFSKTQSYGALVKFKVGGRVIQTVADKPFKNKKQAREYAFFKVNENQHDFMTGSGTIVGTIDVRPRQVHRLTGIGVYSGDYYFTQTTHRLRNEGFYETEFVAYKLLDNSLPALIRRGQITQRWNAPVITPNGIIYP